MEARNLYEQVVKRSLPKEIIDDAIGFSNQGRNPGEGLFRLGFWFGKHIKEVNESIEKGELKDACKV